MENASVWSQGKKTIPLGGVYQGDHGGVRSKDRGETVFLFYHKETTTTHAGVTLNR